MARAGGTAALGIALVLAAAAFGSPSLYVPGIALVLLAAAAALWVAGAATGASLARRPGPATVEEEQPWPLEVVAETGVLPAPGGELREPLLRGALPMAGRTGRHVRVDVTFGRRGRRRLQPAQLVVRDPLGLVERVLEGGIGQEVLVLPRVEPVVASARGAGRAVEAPAGSRPAESSAEIEMESLRPYRDGAPASRIHWPTVARAGTLMERRLLADADSRPLVILDASAPAGQDALDMAVRAAASLCVHLARGGGCAVALPGDRRATELTPDLAAWPAMHARLAMLERTEAAPALRIAARRGATFCVTAAPRDRLLRALERMSGECYLVAPDAVGQLAFTVAGCRGVALRGTRRRAA